LESTRETKKIGLAAPLEPGEIRVHHLLVARDREDQRDVDRDPRRDCRGDRGEPCCRGRNLDHHVRAGHGSMEPTRFVDGPAGVVRQGRIHLEADAAVEAVALREHRMQPVASVLNVLDGQRLEQLLSPETARDQRGERFVIIVGLGDRLVEDGGVRGHPDHTLFPDQAIELAGVQMRAANEIEPYALPERSKLTCATGHGFGT
jgi:hypothetical protein